MRIGGGGREMAEEQQQQQQSEATLILKILNAEGLKDMRFLGKMKSFVVAWIDPRLKRSSQTLTTTSTSPNWYYNYELFFPLTLQTLQNPNSCITIQLLSPSSPIHRERVIGSTILPLTDIRYVEEIFTLQLWRPSGRAQGLLRVSSRIEYYTTTTTNNQHFPSSAAASSYPQLDCVVTGIPVVVESNSLLLDEPVVSGPTTTHVVPVPSAPPLLPVTTTTTTTMSPTTSDQVQTTQNQTPMVAPVQVPEESNVLRSVLIGFLGGAVAVATVLIGGGGTTD